MWQCIGSSVPSHLALIDALDLLVRKFTAASFTGSDEGRLDLYRFQDFGAQVGVSHRYLDMASGQ